MSKTAASVTTNYVQDVASPLPVVLQDGTYSYVYGHGLISRADSSGVQTYPLTDGLGSTTEIVDSGGNILVSYSFDAFGALRSQSATSDNVWLFTGEQRDAESSFDFLRARLYDSSAGRFLGRDRVAAILENPVTQNRYVYAWGNPVNLTDPTGEFPCPFCNEIKNTVEAAVAVVSHAAVFIANLPITVPVTLVATLAGANCSVQSNLLIVCSDAPDWMYFAGGTTYGSVFIGGDLVLDADLIGHEFIHSVQYSVLGVPVFLTVYMVNQAGAVVATEVFELPSEPGCYNLFEITAGLEEGRYICY